MPSHFRIPKAEITGPCARALAAYSRRAFGEVPDFLHVLLHHKPILRATVAYERKVAGWDRLDRNLSSYAVMAAAATVGCSWCTDFGYFLAHNAGLDAAKLREVPRWRDSGVFSPLEREVLAYAEAMSVTPPAVTDEMVGSLSDQLGVEALVELTKMVAVENERSRFNAAMGLATQGFADSCALAPLAT